jgi:hypothetical protein
MSLLENKVNVFDRHKINSFLAYRSAARPLLHKLQEATYKKYKKVWKQLLCFLYRLARKKQGPALHYVLTSSQSASLDCVVQAATELEEQAQRGKSDYSKLDEACLLLCISLLDHLLHSNIYDSVIVGFLAVLGINKEEDSYCHPATYTTRLSAFIKIAQLLIVQRTVLAVERAEVAYLADILDVLQERFMVYRRRSPINWVQKLRTYGKSVQETTTALGYIIWSEDGEEIKYRGLEMSMSGFKHFVLQEVEMAQAQLYELFFVSPEEAPEIVPTLDLEGLKDDPTITTLHWGFLKDP